MFLSGLLICLRSPRKCISQSKTVSGQILQMGAAGFSAQHVYIFPFTTQKQLRTAVPTPTGSSWLKEKQGNCHHSFTLPQVPFQPLPKFLVLAAAQVPALTQFYLPLLVELLPLGEPSCWMAWSKWIKGHLSGFGLLVSFCFVLVPSCWLFVGRGVCLINCLKP